MVIENLIFPWTMFSFSLGFILLLIVGLIIWIWALVDALSSNLPDGDKIIWTIIIIFFHIFGAIIYLVVAKSGAVKDMRMTEQKQGKRLRRDTDNQVLTGVSSGIANYFNIDPVIIRLIWIALALISAGSALIAYVIAAIIIPSKADMVKRNNTKKTAKKAAKKTSKKTPAKKSSKKRLKR
ncbi:MAG: PspC domain-containing protein [Candidatus Woesearchaeota archaeon]